MDEIIIDTRTPTSRQRERDELNQMVEEYIQAGGSIQTIPAGVIQLTEKTRRKHWSCGRNSKASVQKKAGVVAPAGDTDFH